MQQTELENIQAETGSNSRIITRTPVNFLAWEEKPQQNQSNLDSKSQRKRELSTKQDISNT